MFQRALIYLALLMGFSQLVAQNPRLIGTTDIGQDPDDRQSLVHLLHFANKFDIEGIIANADANYEKKEPVIKTSIVHVLTDSYAAIRKNLIKHASVYLDASDL